MNENVSKMTPEKQSGMRDVILNAGEIRKLKGDIPQYVLDSVGKGEAYAKVTLSARGNVCGVQVYNKADNKLIFMNDAPGLYVFRDKINLKAEALVTGVGELEKSKSVPSAKKIF